jgi:hypothetical protein
MNRLATIAIAALVALFVTFGLGWFYGSQRGSASQAQQTSAAYALATARGQLLEGRLELYANNFGNAARHFDDSKRQLGSAIAVLDSEKASEQAGLLRQAVAAVDTAIQRAGRLEPAAHESAAAAQKLIDTVIEQRSATAR